MATTDTIFDELDAAVGNRGSIEALDALAERLEREEKFHELFDVRLIQARLQNGLPIVAAKSLDDLPEAQRTAMEEAYLSACREIGGLLLDRGRLREGWMYLRPTGDRAQIAAALERLPADEHYEAIIEIALHEGVSPELGFRLVLDHYGVCNSISLYDAEMTNRPLSERQAVAALLVRRLHEDLLSNLKADIARQQGSEPKEQTISELVAERDWLFENDNYHVDTTHLSSIVRFAQVVDDPAVLELAWQMTEYGRRLSKHFQFRGDDPFADVYPASALFFEALLGRNVDKAIAYFREQAERPMDEVGTYPAEVFVSLLARVGRHAEALDASSRLLPPGVRTSGLAPSLLELARQGSEFERLMQICRQRGDIVGYTAGLLEQQRAGAAKR